MNFQRSVLYTSGAKLIIFILGFGMSILNARLLGPEGVGIIVLLQLLLNLSVRFTDFGFGRALRYYSANKEISFHILKRVMFWIGWRISIAVMILGITLKFLPIDIWNNIDLKVFIVFLPTLVFYVLTVFQRHLLHGQLQISVVNNSEVLEKIFYMITFVIFVWIFKLGVLGAALSITISTLFIFIILLKNLRDYEKKIIVEKNEIINLNENIRKLWGYGRWEYFGGFLTYLYDNFPLLFLKSQITSFTKIGYLSKAQGLSNYPKILAIPISGLLFSYNAGSQNETSIIRTNVLCRLSFWLSSLFFIALCPFIKPIISLLYGSDFLPSAEVFYYLYPSLVFYIQVLYLSSAIAAKGLNKVVFKISLRSLPISLIICIILITKFELVGAALAFGTSYFVLWVQYVRKYLSISDSKFFELLIPRIEDLHLVIELGKRTFRKKHHLE